MRVLVTGGAGFIGSAVVRHLIEVKHYDVLTVDKLTYAGNLASLSTVSKSSRHRFLNADICDRGAVQDAFSSFQPDYVLHLAAESHVDRSITGSSDFVSTNVIGTFIMLEAARNYWSDLDIDRKRSFRLESPRLTVLSRADSLSRDRCVKFKVADSSPP